MNKNIIVQLFFFVANTNKSYKHKMFPGHNNVAAEPLIIATSEGLLLLSWNFSDLSFLCHFSTSMDSSCFSPSLHDDDAVTVSWTRQPVGTWLDRGKFRKPSTERQWWCCYTLRLHQMCFSMIISKLLSCSPVPWTWFVHQHILMVTLPQSPQLHYILYSAQARHSQTAFRCLLEHTSSLLLLLQVSHLH